MTVGDLLQALKDVPLDTELKLMMFGENVQLSEVTWDQEFDIHDVETAWYVEATKVMYIREGV